MERWEEENLLEAGRNLRPGLGFMLQQDNDPKYTA